MRYREKQKQIDWNDPVNRLVMQLARQGFSVDCIYREVGDYLKARHMQMSEYQIVYRIQQSGSLLGHYRNGQSTIAQMEIVKVRTRVLNARKKLA